MLIERGLEAILIFLCLAGEDQVPAWLQSHWPATWPPLNWNADEIKIAWWVLLVGIWVAASLLLKGVGRALPIFGRDRFPQAALRGVWVLQIANDRPWGLACIDYDWREDQWIYMGVAFDAGLALKAEWKTRGVAITKDLIGWTWQATGEGRLLDQEPNGAIAERSRFDIAVWLDFTRDAKEHGVRAKAVDVNFSAPPAGSHVPHDKLFALTLKHTRHHNAIIEEVRTMSIAQREKLFEPLGRPITPPAHP